MGWQDAPIVAPAAGKPRWQSTPVIGATPAPSRQPVADPAAEAQRLYGIDREYEARAITPPPIDGPAPAQPGLPAGYWDRNRKGASPQSAGEQTLRSLRLGTQDVGRGVAGLVGLPGDIANIGFDTSMSLADMIAGWLGGDLPDVRSPVAGSNDISQATAGAVDAVLGEGAVIPWSDRSQDERVLGRAVELGAESAIGSGLISQGRNVLPRTLTAPFEAAGSDARVLAGDTAAGVGSGAVMQSWREYAPDWLQGPIADIVSGLAGGLGGAKLANVGEGAARGVRGVPDRFTAMPENVIPRDPETMLPVMRDDYARASALLQEKAFDPKVAADEITAYLDAAGPGANPTSALITGDPGLISTERQLRVGDAAPDFIAADQAAMGTISDRVRATRPEGADPEAPRPVAAQSIEAQLAAARQPVDQAQRAVTEQDLILEDIVTALTGGRSSDQASRDLDRAIVEQTYLPDRATKNTLYDAAAANPDTVVRTENVRRTADEMLQRNLGLNPALRDPKATGLAEAFTFPQDGAVPPTGQTLPSAEPPLPPVTRTLKEAMRDRQALSTIESEARAQGNFGRADTARGLKSGVNADVRTAAESGVPGTEALAAADKNYREDFAPTYREGYAAPDFFREIDRDPFRNATPPEMTAGRFLVGGPASRAAAEDVAAIIARTPDPASATASATDYVLSDAVRAGVVRDGRVNEQALAKFMAAREGMFSQIPEIGTRFNDLLQRTQQGNADASALAAELDRTAKNLNLTERQVNEGALKLIAESEPRKAVGRVFAQPDSVAAMREATTTFSADPAAAAGWKAAVSDWLIDHVSTASKAGVAREDVTVTLAKLDRVLRSNEKALAEVFDPNEMNLLKQAQTRLEVLSKRGTQASSGSATAENLRGLRGVVTALANPAGIVTMMTRGALMAGSVERRIKTVAAMFPDADAAANILILRAATDPRIMEHMLRFPTTDAQVYTWSAKLNELLVGGEAGSGEQE